MPTSSTRPDQGRRFVCIQGLGFVGAAMAVATATARRDGRPIYDVVGVELDSPSGRDRAAAIADGRFPFATTDQALVSALATAHRAGNLAATTDPAAFSTADIIVVDVHLDIDLGTARVDLGPFRRAIRTVADRVKPGALVIVETTVPPGTVAAVVEPEIAEALKRRELPKGSVLIAHSYERVMPGPGYLDSITGMDRVYSGITEAAADACEAFLRDIIDTSRAKLTRLKSPTASETAKILENTYRAVTIALMDEWGRFAESAGVDMFEIVDAIRMRPTHSNIRQPGLGVGGYCITKDPLFSVASARQLLSIETTSFPLSRLALDINREMPVHAVDVLRAQWPNGLRGRTMLVCGVAYRSDVDDTRFAPSEAFVRAARRDGATVLLHDPLARSWPELGEPVPGALPDAALDAVVLAVAHSSYRDDGFLEWLMATNALIFDTNRVLPQAWIDGLLNAGRRVLCLGRGDISS